MKTTWIMNTNMGQDSDMPAYIQAVKDSGANIVEVDYKPFSGETTPVDVDGPVVVYGAVKFITKLYEDGRYAHGIFGTPETFTYQAWAEHYNEMLLNSPDGVQLMTIKDFLNDTREAQEFVFIRPQHDTKSLVGTVWEAGEFKAWCAEVIKGKFDDVNGDTPIVVAHPYGIEAEWRLFVVDNKVISASQCRKKGRLFKELGAPQDVLDFAQKVIDRWTPARAYTLDICRSAGNCYIVEAQGFNSAGHYAADIGKVVQAVNEVAIDIWKKSQLKMKP